MTRGLRTHVRTHLFIEQLERRELLAGDVSASVDQLGVLRITGDSKANCVELDYTTALVVRGCGAGGKATTINRSAQPLTVSGPTGRDLLIQLQGGDDSLRIGDGLHAVLLGDVNINMGDGENQVAIKSDTDIGETLRVRSGSGVDSIRLEGAVHGDVSVFTGAGTDLVTLVAVSVDGRTLLTTGTADDHAGIKGSHFGQAFSVVTGSGNDLVEIDDSHFKSAVDVIFGDGDDALGVGGSTGSVFEDESVQFNGGAGIHDRYVIQNSTFAGSPVIGDLVTGFEHEVDSRSFLRNTPISQPASQTKYRDCSNRTLEPGANLSKCDVRPLPIAGLDLTNANMSSANLAGMNLDVGPDDPRTILNGVNLSKADVTNTVFSNTVMRGANLNRALATGTSYEDTDLVGADFTSADLRNASFFFTNAREALFRRANLMGASLRGASFDDADFNRADMRSVDATAASFVGADLTLVDLTFADLTRADLTGALLHRAKGLTTVTWSNTICPDGTNSDNNGETCLGHL
jgi:uncharacterized protein YjbI with pentapeptide repeats